MLLVCLYILISLNRDHILIKDTVQFFFLFWKLSTINIIYLLFLKNINLNSSEIY